MCRATLAFVLVAIMALVANAEVMDTRECVLDRKVHIEDSLVTDVPQVPPLCDSIKGLKKGKINIGGCNLYCEREGKGMPIVLLNGGPGCTHQIFHPEFSQAAKFAQVIYYDQRGVGQSDYDASAKTYTVRQAVEDLENLRKALKIEKWIVVGHSYGGFLAQCYALEHPESLMGLVLVCSLPGTPNVPLGSRQDDYITTKEMAKFNSINADDTLTKEQKGYNGFMNGGWKHQNFYRPTDDEIARIARYEWKPAPGFRERIWADEARIDLENKFDSFDIPTLIVEAKWDLTWTADKPRKILENHPGAKLVVFDHSGHSPFSDEPDLFFSTLSDFIKVAKAAPAPAAGRVGKRMAWPPAVIGKITAMGVPGDAQLAGMLLQEAEKEHMKDYMSWIRLGLSFYAHRRYDKALIAVQHLEDLVGKDGKPWERFEVYAFKGLILDLVPRRPEAVRCYEQSLDCFTKSGGKPDPSYYHFECSQLGLLVEPDWVKERLKTPFVRK